MATNLTPTMETMLAPWKLSPSTLQVHPPAGVLQSSTSIVSVFVHSKTSLRLFPDQDCPQAVHSQEEAVALITYTQQLKVLLEESKEQSLKQLQRALNKVELADKQLLEAEIHIGKVQHIVKKSGFQVPKITRTWRRQVLEVNGGMLIPTFEIVIDSWIVLCSTAFHSGQLRTPSPCRYHLRSRGYQHLHILSLLYDV